MKMEEIEILMQKYPFLYNLVKYKSDCIKILDLLNKRAMDIDEISKNLNLKKYVVEEYIQYLLNHKMMDKLYLNNKILYYPTLLGKKFIEAYDKEY